MLYCAEGSPRDRISSRKLRELINQSLDRLGSKKRVLVVPPDITRAHSRAGEITRMIWDYYQDRLAGILPALGTHTPMTDPELDEMYPGIPRELFLVHRWREDVVTLGEVPASYVEAQSHGKVSFSWPAQVNRMLVEGGFDLILSVGQVVPHEVIGMANYNKNIFVGVGGREGIDRSHYLSGVVGTENIMGIADNPVRRVMNYAHREFASQLPLMFIHTVVGREAGGDLALRGLFVGDDDQCFYQAAELSRAVNITKLEKPLKKVVVYLDPREFRSTWLGNKAIYRTRMAIADGGELIVLAPGVQEFGEDPELDRMIRRCGYRGTEAIVSMVDRQEGLHDSLSAAAHLIHGSTEGRFTVTYCPGKLTREEIEQVGFSFGDIETMMHRYDPEVLKEGFNTLDDGEEIYFIENPAVGLWASAEKLEEGDNR